MFFSSLITPLILLVLYTTFLKNVFEDSFRGALDAAGAAVSDSIIGGCVGGQLVSSLLAVSCVTVAFCSNLLMVQDKISGARRDLTFGNACTELLCGVSSEHSDYLIRSICSMLCLSRSGRLVSFNCGRCSRNRRCDSVVPVRNCAFFLRELSAYNAGSGLGSRNDCQCRLRIYLRSIYADFSILGRTSKSSFLPPGDIRNQHAEKSCTARRIRRNVRPRISGSGDRIHQGQCRLQHIFLRR